MANCGNVVEFPLSAVVKIEYGDIARWFVDGVTDAIVNSANEKMLGGGGADGAIHRLAGPELREACFKFPEIKLGVRCPREEARITPGFKLSASHVIHAVGPKYETDSDPEATLQNAYRNSLKLAKENNLKYVAFPALSCGMSKFPHQKAAEIALSTVKEFQNDFKEVHFVHLSGETYNAWLNKAKELF